MYARHSLVWLNDAGWRQALADAPVPERDAIERWRNNDWPAIARRREPGAPADAAYLGIAAPPVAERGIERGVKRRIALCIASTGVRSAAPPLPLATIIEAMPSGWRAALRALDQESAAHGIGLRVYGSAAMQCATKLAYLTARSDIDLLFYPRTAMELETGLDLLAGYANHLPLDGEIVFPDQQAVAWKEWHAALRSARSTRVMVKQSEQVRLASMPALLSTLARTYA